MVKTGLKFGLAAAVVLTLLSRYVAVSFHLFCLLVCKEEIRFSDNAC